MAIQLQCTCGRSLTLRDELAGKIIRCPACAGALTVPSAAEEVVEVVEEAVAIGPPPLPRAQQKVAAVEEVVEEVVEVESVEAVAEAVSAGPPPLPKPPRKERYDAPPPRRREDRLPERKKKKKGSVYSETYAKKKAASSLVFEEGWFGNGIVGGAAMMGLGILIFLVIFLLGVGLIRALIWAALLFVGGMLAMLKGLMDLYGDDE